LFTLGRFNVMSTTPFSRTTEITSESMSKSDKLAILKMWVESLGWGTVACDLRGSR
jgi:hypothetical protein